MNHGTHNLSNLAQAFNQVEANLQQLCVFVDSEQMLSLDFQEVIQKRINLYSKQNPSNLNQAKINAKTANCESNHLTPARVEVAEICKAASAVDFRFHMAIGLRLKSLSGLMSGLFVNWRLKHTAITAILSTGLRFGFKKDVAVLSGNQPSVRQMEFKLNQLRRDLKQVMHKCESQYTGNQYWLS